MIHPFPILREEEVMCYDQNSWLYNSSCPLGFGCDIKLEVIGSEPWNESVTHICGVRLQRVFSHPYHNGSCLCLKSTSFLFDIYRQRLTCARFIRNYSYLSNLSGSYRLGIDGYRGAGGSSRDIDSLSLATSLPFVSNSN